MKKCKNNECNNEVQQNKQYCCLSCRNIYVNKNLRDYNKISSSLSQKKNYKGKEKKCKKCQCLIPYEKRRNKYCSHSCAVSISNKDREVKESTKALMKSKRLEQLKLHKYIMVNCKNCNLELKLHVHRKNFCDSKCKKEYQRKNMSEFKKYKQDCLFTFSLNSYPDEFEFDLIKKYGWYKPVNRGNNLNGVSRDHMFSIMEGFLNNIDSKLISHPANCKLVLQKENSSKHKKSSITLDELIERIENWNKKYNHENSTRH